MIEKKNNTPTQSSQVQNSKNETPQAQKVIALFSSKSPIFNYGLAKEIGLNESILLLQLDYLLRHSFQVEFFEGNHWLCLSIRFLQKKCLLDFWSFHTVNRILQNLIDRNYILVQPRNQFKNDKQRLFALNADGLSTLTSIRAVSIPANNDKGFHALSQDETALSQNETALSQDETAHHYIVINKETTTTTQNSFGKQASAKKPGKNSSAGKPCQQIGCADAGVDFIINQEKILEDLKLLIPNEYWDPMTKGDLNKYIYKKYDPLEIKASILYVLHTQKIKTAKSFRSYLAGCLKGHWAKNYLVQLEWEEKQKEQEPKQQTKPIAPEQPEKEKTDPVFEAWKNGLDKTELDGYKENYLKQANIILKDRFDRKGGWNNGIVKECFAVYLQKQFQKESAEIEK